MLSIRCRAIFIAAIPCLLLPLTGLADAMVWKISKGKDKLFVGGTIHMLSTSDYPLPKEYQQAYTQADTIVFEADVEEMKSTAAQQLFLSKSSYPPGQTIQQELDDSTFKLLQQFFTSRDLPGNAFLQLKPAILAITLPILELQRHGIDGPGVDEFYTRKTIEDGKKRKALETIHQQLTFINKVNHIDSDLLIQYTLREISNVVPMLNSMITAWRFGNTEQLEKLIISDMKTDYPVIYNALLRDRNTTWTPQIESMFDNNETEFILVGAAHLIGDESVLKQLQAKGYDIEKLSSHVFNLKKTTSIGE